jgi:hypothetical protein
VFDQLILVKKGSGPAVDPERLDIKLRSDRAGEELGHGREIVPVDQQETR